MLRPFSTVLLGTVDPIDPKFPVNNLFSCVCSCSEHEAGEWFLLGLQLSARVWPLVKETLYKLPWNTIKLALLIQGGILGVLVSRMTRVSVCVCACVSVSSPLLD